MLIFKAALVIMACIPVAIAAVKVFELLADEVIKKR